MNHQQVIWASRRGMLELDILLEQFAMYRYPQLTDGEQALFQQFLSENDQNLYDWLLKKKLPENAQYFEIIELIHINNSEHYGQSSTLH